jgi:hypothetical protein
MPSRPRCPACGGDGKCRECFGSGTNIHLNEDEPKCRNAGEAASARPARVPAANAAARKN